jgi:hypothetical protein
MASGEDALWQAGELFYESALDIYQFALRET